MLVLVSGVDVVADGVQVMMLVLVVMRMAEEERGELVSFRSPQLMIRLRG